MPGSPRAKWQATSPTCSAHAPARGLCQTLMRGSKRVATWAPGRREYLCIWLRLRAADWAPQQRNKAEAGSSEHAAVREEMFRPCPACRETKFCLSALRMSDFCMPGSTGASMGTGCHVGGSCTCIHIGCTAVPGVGDYPNVCLPRKPTTPRPTQHIHREQLPPCCPWPQEAAVPLIDSSWWPYGGMRQIAAAVLF